MDPAKISRFTNKPALAHITCRQSLMVGVVWGAVNVLRHAQGEPAEQQVEVGSAILKKQKDGAKCLHFFCTLDP